MFKIPTYDELEKKEKEQNEKNKEIKSNLFEKRKQLTLDDSYTIKSAGARTSGEAATSPEKKARTEPPVMVVVTTTTSSQSNNNNNNKKIDPINQKDNDDDDDEDSLLMAFIDEKKDVIDQSPRQQTTPKKEAIFKVPELPSIPTATSTTSTTTGGKFLPPNATNTNTNATGFGSGSGGALIVNSKQKGNPILKHIRNVQWKYSDTLVPDYCMSRASCAFFLSMKYHLLNPTYIHQRVKELGKAYDLRVLLVQVDVKEPRHCIKELEKISIYSNLTMILCWTPEEAGRYLETYKAYEFKSADLIMEKSSAAQQQSETGKHQTASGGGSADAVFIANFTDFLCQIKSINKTDASTLRRTFGSISEIAKASKEELNLCPGLGPLKVNRLYNIFRTPFLLPKKPLM